MHCLGCRRGRNEFIRLPSRLPHVLEPPRRRAEESRGEMHLLWLESKKLEKHHGTDSPKVVSSNSSPERWVRRSFYHSLRVSYASHTPTCIADRFRMRKNTEHNRMKLRLGLEKTQREGGLHQLCELTFFVVFPKLA